LNEHNGWVPRDLWLEEWEKEAIMTFMMLDADIVAVSPTSVARVGASWTVVEVDWEAVEEGHGL